MNKTFQEIKKPIVESKYEKPEIADSFKEKKQKCEKSYGGRVKDYSLDCSPFKCKHCFRSFSNDEMLQQHQRRFMGIKSYRCEECGDIFTKETDFFQHQRQVKFYFICLHCAKSFKDQFKKCKKILSKVNLENKTIACSMKMGFHCDKCGKKFKREKKYKF